ncbi:MAG: hypothetical protein Q7U40_06570 [Desulfatirhabdiaceae bacterium]|nr:hypothetical protein [Desulfatirhabdiaceae bacterium]
MKHRFRPTQTYSRDTGLIIVLALLLTAYWKNNLVLILPATGTLIAAMTIPMIFLPAAVIWYYFSLLLGEIANRIVLSFFFIAIITPVSLVRRCMGFDPMLRKQWKKGHNSVFIERKHTFVVKDLTTPF